jgi:hypothetical protein
MIGISDLKSEVSHIDQQPLETPDSRLPCAVLLRTQIECAEEWKERSSVSLVLVCNPTGQLLPSVPLLPVESVSQTWKSQLAP